MQVTENLSVFSARNYPKFEQELQREYSEARAALNGFSHTLWSKT